VTSASILGSPDKPGGAYGGPDKPPAKKRRKPQIGKPATYTPGKTKDPREKPAPPKEEDLPKQEHSNPVAAAAERYLKRKAS